MGMTAVVDAGARVVGIFTDGDLRRCVTRVTRFRRDEGRRADDQESAQRSMRNALAIDCVELMETPPKVSQLLVVDDDARLVGALHLHDLFRAKVV